MTGLLGLLFELAVGLWAIKWLLLPAVVIGVPWLTVRAGRAYEARQRIEAWSQAELAWCADQPARLGARRRPTRHLRRKLSPQPTGTDQKCIPSDLLLPTSRRPPPPPGGGTTFGDETICRFHQFRPPEVARLRLHRGLNPHQNRYFKWGNACFSA